MNTDTILSMSKINKSFFGVSVLKDVDLDLKRGEILGLVGENGAGKSTLMNILGGILRKDSGHMTINDKVYEPTNPKDAQDNKISFIHQELNLFTNLTVAENLFIDDFPTKGLNLIQYKKMRKAAKAHLKNFGIEVSPNAKVGELPMGVRQTVEITKAVIKNAEVIIFDEPTTSLSQKEKTNLFKIINNLKEKGVSIIYISHILDDVFHLCDRITVLRDGRVIDTVEKAAISKTEIIKMMVGRELHQVYPTVSKEIGKEVFKAEEIHQGKMVKSASVTLREGEIVGVFGLLGAGRTEFARAIFGVDKLESGAVYFHGEKLKKLCPEECIKKGIAFITEDRRAEGLLMPKSIRENLILVRMKDILTSLGIINRKVENTETDKIIKDLNIKLQDKNLQFAQSLSGGNQQKVVIGKWLLINPKVLIMDEPTRGVDVGAKYEIYSIINELAKQGSAVLFISSEMEELMGVCDRILIMRKGEVVGEVPKHEYDQETIIRYALEGGF